MSSLPPAAAALFTEKLPCYGGEMELKELGEVSAEEAGVDGHKEQQVGAGAGAGLDAEL